MDRFQGRKCVGRTYAAYRRLSRKELLLDRTKVSSACHASASCAQAFREQKKLGRNPSVGRDEPLPSTGPRSLYARQRCRVPRTATRVTRRQVRGDAARVLIYHCRVPR
ncbi:unnamed protein product, partial [Trichogramma brassicae]